MPAMSDPAVEAAQRCADRYGIASFHVMATAAREALAPIRELHRPFDRAVTYGSDETVKVCNHCLGPIPWPCTTAIYAYTSEELGL